MNITFDISAIFAAIFAFTGVLLTIRSNKIQSEMKNKIEILRLETEKERSESEEKYKNLIIELEKKKRAADSISNEVTECIKCASTLFACIELKNNRKNIDEDKIYDAIKSIENLSLYYKPNTEFNEKIVSDLAFAGLYILNSEISENKNRILELKMNLWALIARNQEQIKEGTFQELELNIKPYG